MREEEGQGEAEEEGEEVDRHLQAWAVEEEEQRRT